jgi:hypothetical protein
MANSNPTKKLQTAILTLGLCLGATNVQAQSTCWRWNSRIDACGAGIPEPDCKGTLTRAQLMHWYRELYFGTAIEACASYWRSKKWYKKVGIKPLPNQPAATWQACFRDSNGNGIMDTVDDDPNDLWPDEYGDSSWVERWPVERDSCCSLVPNHTRYSSLGATEPAMTRPGSRFTSTQRQAILQWNEQQGGQGHPVSDAFYDNDGVILDPYNNLLSVVNPKWYYFSDDDMTMVWADDMPQIDHIVPRVESHGCPCGTSEWSNAAVISARLNVTMSNDCEHPERIRMFEKFVPGYTPPPPQASTGRLDTAIAAIPWCANEPQWCSAG